VRNKIFPFLFATFPVLFLFAHNIGEVPAISLLLPILAVISITLTLLALARLTIKNPSKAAIIVSFTMFWIFAYGYIEDSWQSLGGTVFEWRPGTVIMVLWGTTLAAVIFGIIRMRGGLDAFTKYLGLMGATLVVISLASIGAFAIRAATVDVAPESAGEESNGTAAVNQADLPDIYYIILDRYARADVLDEFYGYDNSEFIDELRDRGFYIASGSRCNYSITPSSLASSLNMEYINYLSDVFGEDSQDVNALLEIVANNKVARYLKTKGYSDIYIATGPRVPGLRAVYTEILENQARFGLSYFASSAPGDAAEARSQSLYLPRLQGQDTVWLRCAGGSTQPLQQPCLRLRPHRVSPSAVHVRSPRECPRGGGDIHRTGNVRQRGD